MHSLLAYLYQLNMDFKLRSKSLPRLVINLWLHGNDRKVSPSLQPLPMLTWTCILSLFLFC